MKVEVEAKCLLPIGLDIQLGIDDVYFKEGDRVKKGDIIIKFSDYKSKDLETKLYNQKQELAVKTSQLRYLQEQYKLGADVTDQIQKLTGEIKALEGELATASKEKSLVQRVVMSPIDGYIVKLNAVKGGTTDSLTPVVILAKTHDIKIVSEPFPANKLQYVNLGNKAEIKAINNSETKFEGILYKISDILDSTDPNMLYELDTEEESMENRVLYKHKPKDETFKITRDDTGAYVVSGPGIERAFLMTDFNRDASVRRFAQQMRSMGVDDALRERGCKNGDTVKILKGEFEFVE